MSLCMVCDVLGVGYFVEWIGVFYKEDKFFSILFLVRRDGERKEGRKEESEGEWI